MESDNNGIDRTKLYLILCVLLLLVYSAAIALLSSASKEFESLILYIPIQIFGQDAILSRMGFVTEFWPLCIFAFSYSLVPALISAWIGLRVTEKVAHNQVKM